MTWNLVDLATTLRALVEHARRHPADVERVAAVLAEIADELAPADGPLKNCRCGASYDRAGWAALPLVGMQSDGGGGLTAELRNCARCNSTLGVTVGPTEPPETTPGPRTCATAAPSGDSAGGTTPPVCEGCGGALTAEQLSRGARACSGACRAKASRERARAKRLAAIDAAARALEEARAEIARG